MDRHKNPQQNQILKSTYLCRTPKLAGRLVTIKVMIDDRLIGELRGSGFLHIPPKSESAMLEYKLHPGEYWLTVSGGGCHSNTLQVTIKPGDNLKFETYFSIRGALGGWIQLKQS